MVFLTSIIIVAIIYYLQADGLIYATIVAVIAELLNLFMSNTLSKSVEKKLNAKWGKIVNNYKNQVNAKTRTIEEFERVQEKTISKLTAANQKIKAYEEKYGEMELPKAAGGQNGISPLSSDEPQKEEPGESYDLPCGSDGLKK